MGYRKYIRDNMPAEWAEAARRIKFKTELVERLYDNLPTWFKNLKSIEQKPFLKRQVRRYFEDMFKSNPIYYINAEGMDTSRLRLFEQTLTQVKEEWK